MSMVSLKRVMKALPKQRRARIEARAAKLIADEMTLREVRKRCEVTQQQLSRLLGIGQDGVSRLERREDLLLSTLQSVIAAMGGKLRLVVEFPDRAPIALRGLMDESLRGRPSQKK
jgi:DNA-binding transcriptional regulator YiaG